MRKLRKVIAVTAVSVLAASVMAGCGAGNGAGGPSAAGEPGMSAGAEEGGSAGMEKMPSQTMVNVDETLSMDDAIVTDMTVKLDGSDVKVTLYEDCYVKNPTNVAMIPNADGVDQKISIYVPENATKDAPIIFSVNNAGWIMDAYMARTQMEEGKDYASNSDNDVIGKVLSKGYVLVSFGARSRGDNQDADGKYISHSPATITDTKAVIRYLRNNAEALPAGDPEKIVITGTSGGGALSTIIASSGNSEDYFASLYEIGAAGIEQDGDSYTSTINDDIFATIAYCPINDLREADAAYEFTYKDVRQRLVDDGLPAVDQKTGETFQDPFTDTYTPEWMMEASEALAPQYGEYVTSLGLKTDGGDPLTGENLTEEMIVLLNRSLAKASADVGTEQMMADLDGSANYSGQDVTGVFNNTSEGWTDFLTISDADGIPYIADEEALQNFLYFVARNQTLKVACAFSNKGLSEEGLASVSGFNEDSLFGTTEYPYSAYEFYSWDNDAVSGNGCGLDDTGLTWDEFMETEDGALLADQMKMSSPIPYLAEENGDSAPNWYVRHGFRDRDTAFALQTVLYHALSNDTTIENLDFAFAWLQPHAGDYDVQEAYAWLDEVLAQ